jgi:hypothetical protein
MHPCGSNGLIAERDPDATADLVVFAYCPFCGRKLEANAALRGGEAVPSNGVVGGE